MSAEFLVLGEFPVAVRLGKVAQKSVWQPFAWKLLDMGPMESLTDLQAQCGPDDCVQTVCARIFQDELQGYFLNLDSDTPVLFFLLRYPEDRKTERPELFQATFSYDEAARWMDSSEEVQTLPLPVEVCAWLAELVQARYQPEPKRRRRPQSFVAPEKREV